MCSFFWFLVFVEPKARGSGKVTVGGVPILFVSGLEQLQKPKPCLDREVQIDAAASDSASDSDSGLGGERRIGKPNVKAWKETGGMAYLKSPVN